MSDETQELLSERGKTHGRFKDHAKATIALKAAFAMNEVPFSTEKAPTGRQESGKLSFVQREAVHMILHKLGHIAAGNPNFCDHWDDIAGYAKLVSNDLKEKGFS